MSMRRRNPLLVGALTVVTYGAYFVFWFGMTWREMALKINSRRMNAVGHSAALLIPIYGLFRLADHFNTLDEIAQELGVAGPPRPLQMVSLATVAAILASPLNVFVSFVIFDAGAPPLIAISLPFIVAFALAGAVAAWGQRTLNRCWNASAAGGLSVATGLSMVERAVLALGTASFIWMAILASVALAR